MKIILFCTLFLFSCSKKDSEKMALTFKGSNTSNHIVSEIAKMYNKSAQKKIKVMGGGSEEAIREFVSGDLNYLNSSRKLTIDEISKTEKLLNKKVKEIIIGLDALAIIVNPKLGVHELSLHEISEIFEGKKTNWKEFGGPNLKITIYGRKNTSGTFHFVKDKFAPNGFVKGIVEKNNSAEIVKAIKNDLSGFSYVDLASISSKEHFPINGIWAINISIDGGNSISPFERLAVLDGKYPLSRPLFQYIIDADNEIVNDFIKFELSDIGQDLIERKGFFKILPMHIAWNKENGY